MVFAIQDSLDQERRQICEAPVLDTDSKHHLKGRALFRWLVEWTTVSHSICDVLITINTLLSQLVTFSDTLYDLILY